MKSTLTRRLVSSSFAGGIVAAGVFLVAPAAPAQTSDLSGHDAADAVTGHESSKGSGPASQEVAGTGADTTTDVLGILGAGLVGGGIASVVVNRRRRRARVLP